MGGGKVLKGGWEEVFPAVSQQRMFEVISSFDAYPHFVPGCLEARILERQGDAALRVESGDFGELGGGQPARRRRRNFPSGP